MSDDEVFAALAHYLDRKPKRSSIKASNICDCMCVAIPRMIDVRIGHLYLEAL